MRDSKFVWMPITLIHILKSVFKRRYNYVTLVYEKAFPELFF